MMDCHRFTLVLDEFLDRGLDGLRTDACQLHLGICASCRRQVAAELQLREQLRNLPVPPPSAEYPSRVFDKVREATQAQPAWRPAAYALAASVTLGIGLALSLQQWKQQAVAPTDQASAPASVVTLATGQTQPVRLMFRSPRALSGVTIQLELPQGVELAGYPGQRELAWETNLQSGANLLELPVIVQDGEGGVLTARVDYGPDSREFVVEVRARRPAASLGRFMETAMQGVIIGGVKIHA